MDFLWPALYKPPQINALSQKHYFQGGGVSESAKIQTQTIDYMRMVIQNHELFQADVALMRVMEEYATNITRRQQIGIQLKLSVREKVED